MSHQIMTPERIAEINRIACNLDRENPAYGALNEALDALEAAQQEIEALREEVLLTNAHEHAIMVELSAARDEIADLKRGGVVVPDIPSDRVLGEGDRVVGREEWMYLAALERYARKHGPESIQDVIECLDHLRAQATQEPANGIRHVHV